MLSFTGNKAAVALFVEDILQTFGLDFQSIMIIPVEQSEDCSVRIATDISLVATVLDMASNYSLELTSILQLPTQAG